MRVKKETLIVDEFKKNINNIFKNNIVFAFLCGSFVSGNYTDKSDIDMVVCLKKRDKKMEKEFLKWYFFVHKKTGNIPDDVYNYEVCNQNQIGSSLNFIEKFAPMIKINSHGIYDGIVLAGMLSGTVVGFVGDYKKYLFFRKKAHKITRRWKQQLLKTLSTSDADIFLKRVIKYEGNNI